MTRRLDREDAIHAALRRLEQHATFSPFSRFFYRFIFDLLRTQGLEAPKLKQAFEVFLRCEGRRHRAIRHIVHRGRIDLVEIARTGRSVHNLLLRVRRTVELTEPLDGREALLRELILAECSYQLGRNEEVIDALRRAISLGCNFPLVHFALGYNIYLSAFQRFARKRARGDERKFDVTAFEEVCREAIEAFRGGLSDMPFDGHIYWWMGLISEMLGERVTARQAFLEALQADPGNFRERVEKKLQTLMEPLVVERTDEERDRLAQLAPITGDDVEAARKVLDESCTFPEFFLGTEGES